MIKSELYQLEKHIGDILSREQGEDTNRHPGKLEEELKNVLLLCHGLKTKWVRELFSSVKEHVIQRYVHYHQAGLTSLSDLISQRLAATDFKAANKAPYFEGYQQLLSGLEDLLYFFKHSFYKYFDPDYKITVYQCLKDASRFGELQHGLNKPANSNPSLATLISALLSSVSDLYEEACIEGISYRQAEHVLSLLRTAFYMLNSIEDITPDTLARSLYKQNLNTLYFFNWYKNFLAARISFSAETAGIDKAIEGEVMSLENLFVDPAKSFEPKLPPIDFMVIGWLKEQTSGNRAVTSPETTQKFSNGQLGLNLSVAQFALFIRVFYQAGCFSTTNISRIMRFFSHYFTTKKQSNISMKSFGRAYYSSDQSSAAVVRDYLQKMINYIDKTFFP